jgi:hypothetical protein
MSIAAARVWDFGGQVTTYQPVVGKPPAPAPVVTVRKRRVLEIV